ncbi:hypothetical protein FVE67_03585 [Thermosulfurimonas marina]|uniref:DAC domain-containing protein n=1 Tax=Thermosulfurimonas marina TaxID=2047767 RepID=A0A6H1WS03_9BACT|nr:diadenylate cyclase [Thermosulfurimonas marina]QJA05934.1 hypothetical protein FVE67_03585 [Thermosulfurimonas marina]
MDKEKLRISVTEKFLGYAADLSETLPSSAILVYADVFPGGEELARFLEHVRGHRVVLVTREAGFEGPEGTEVIEVPGIKLTRLGQIKVAVLIGVARGLFNHEDLLICLSGVAESGHLDSLFILDLESEFEIFAVSQLEDLREIVRPEVFQRVLSLAIVLATQGREGRPVGTCFILGDSDEVLQHCDQMVINPFKGYPENERNILDPRLEETVKEFALLDGAFVIRGDGVIESAGAYIRTGVVSEDIPSGLGARHRSAAAITALTRAVAITVSESTGTVTVFRNGKIVMEIEKPHPLGPETEWQRAFYAGPRAPSEWPHQKKISKIP